MRGGPATAALCLAAPGARAEAPEIAASETRRSAQDAADLQAAFSHDLCTRDDRAPRNLDRDLGRKPVSAH